MNKEIQYAVEFICQILQGRLSTKKIREFADELATLLKHKLLEHWDVLTPNKGNGYRAILFTHDKLDPILEAACQNCFISSTLIINIVSDDMVLWIDPYNVSYRLGEFAPIFVLYEDRSLGKLDSLLSERAMTKVQVTIKAPSKKGHPNGYSPVLAN